MRYAKDYRKNIFCLEGEWLKDLRKKRSIVDALIFLEKNSTVKYIHRNCNTVEEFANRFVEYKKAIYKDYSICYLAYHGKPNGIMMGKNILTLDEIAEISSGQLKNKIIHFGSCSSLKLDKRHLKKFLEKTEALCISGFTIDVDFIPSSVFDLLYFEICQRYKDITCIERDMKRYYGKLVKELSFRMVYL